MPLRLEFLDSFKLKNESLGLTEPSGLAMDPDGDSLWVVSDDTARLFQIDLAGEVLTTVAATAGLEGITIRPDSDVAVVVREEDNALMEIELSNASVRREKPIAQMRGYERISEWFAGAGNKGLEGITFSADGTRLFALKEGRPGLLIELSPDLDRIESTHELDASRGFQRDGLDDDELDFSGLAVADGSRLLWIASDKGKCVFLYDLPTEEVVATYELFATSAAGKQVKKAEGVAFAEHAQRLYVVSDEKSRLYVYEVRGLEELIRD